MATAQAALGVREPLWAPAGRPRAQPGQRRSSVHTSATTTGGVTWAFKIIYSCVIWSTYFPCRMQAAADAAAQPAPDEPSDGTRLPTARTPAHPEPPTWGQAARARGDARRCPHRTHKPLHFPRIKKNWQQHLLARRERRAHRARDPPGRRGSALTHALLHIFFEIFEIMISYESTSFSLGPRHRLPFLVRINP